MAHCREGLIVERGHWDEFEARAARPWHAGWLKWVGLGASGWEVCLRFDVWCDGSVRGAVPRRIVMEVELSQGGLEER